MKYDIKEYPHEAFVQESMIRYLTNKGYSKSMDYKGLSEAGVDIRVRHKDYSRFFLIECKGGAIKAKSVSGTESVNFTMGLGQIIQRIHSKTIPTAAKGAYKYGVAYPAHFKEKHLWKLHYNVCRQLNLYVFFVDMDGNVEEYNWQRIKKEYPDD